MRFKNHFLFLFLSLTYVAQADDRELIRKLSGCYQVDYTYSEIEPLLDTYRLDPRVYDATKRQDVYEYVVVVEDTEESIRLQHILMLKKLNGWFSMKHHGEHWQANAPFRYHYMGENTWTPVAIDEAGWTRTITSLDDGPRYSCQGVWDISGARNLWKCTETYSPIPGREYRDMGRKDYQGLTRSAQIQVYDWGWLERQENVKVTEAAGHKTPLVREEGKIFSIRVDDAFCAPARDFVAARKNYWDISRAVWSEVLDGGSDFTSLPLKGGERRYNELWRLESKYFEGLSDAGIVDQVKTEMRSIIDSYR